MASPYVAVKLAIAPSATTRSLARNSDWMTLALPMAACARRSDAPSALASGASALVS